MTDVHLQRNLNTSTNMVTDDCQSQLQSVVNDRTSIEI